ncbi:MAG: YgiQ family radical SAM protein [Planctomycetota bacterium]
MFLPTTRQEMDRLGWDKPDIILVTGDAYIDSSYVGVAVIGHVLADAGYRVCIIAQPDTRSDNDIMRLGEPALFWGVAAGAADSMVANYTALKKPRRDDDFTPGGKNTKRPDRASIVYTNLIRKYFKNTKPIVLGGVEASLRRISHYDYWDDKVRKSILFDAKADILIYGMAERAVLDLAERLKKGQDFRDIHGICYIAPEPKNGCLILPAHEQVKSDKSKFIEMFNVFYANNDPIIAQGLCQKQDTRYLIQNPPAELLNTAELDRIYELSYENAVHPYCLKQGKVKAIETIQFSITSHRGCYGECNFCAIAVHQGRTVVSRSEESIIREAAQITRQNSFKGYIHDIGGPTANMLYIECARKLKAGGCNDKRCLSPMICKALKIDHNKQIELLKKLRMIKGIKKVFIGSGIRYDMVLEDKQHGAEYMEELVNHHISGQLKIAPEHTEDKILGLMGKPAGSPADRGKPSGGSYDKIKAGWRYLQEFKKEFDRLNIKFGKKQFLTYYFIAAHPGCDVKDMIQMRKFIREELKMTPEQVQIFTPTPSIYSTLMYYTGINPFTSEKLFVENDNGKKGQQKEIIVN